MTASPTSSRPKIMVIEDDKLLVKLLERLFNLFDYDIATALDASEALKKLAKTDRKPDLILLDLVLPGLSGLEFLQQIKASAEYKDIPVIVLTNLGSQSYQNEAIGLGAAMYLTKSEHEPEKIVEAVRETIKGWWPQKDINLKK